MRERVKVRQGRAPKWPQSSKPPTRSVCSKFTGQALFNISNAFEKVSKRTVRSVDGQSNLCMPNALTSLIDPRGLTMPPAAVLTRWRITHVPTVTLSPPYCCLRVTLNLFGLIEVLDCERKTWFIAGARYLFALNEGYTQGVCQTSRRFKNSVVYEVLMLES